MELTGVHGQQNTKLPITVIGIILNSLIQLVSLPAKSVHCSSPNKKREAYVTFHLFCAARYFKTPKELKLSSSELISAVIMESSVLRVVTPFSLVEFFYSIYKGISLLPRKR